VGTASSPSEAAALAAGAHPFPNPQQLVSISPAINIAIHFRIIVTACELENVEGIAGEVRVGRLRLRSPSIAEQRKADPAECKH